MAFPQIICETNNDECLKYIMDLTLSSTYQRACFGSTTCSSVSICV